MTLFSQSDNRAHGVCNQSHKSKDSFYGITPIKRQFLRESHQSKDSFYGDYTNQKIAFMGITPIKRQFLRGLH
jgi:hypothetical protein